MSAGAYLADRDSGGKTYLEWSRFVSNPNDSPRILSSHLYRRMRFDTILLYMYVPRFLDLPKAPTDHVESGTVTEEPSCHINTTPNHSGPSLAYIMNPTSPNFYVDWSGRRLSSHRYRDSAGRVRHWFMQAWLQLAWRDMHRVNLHERSD